jgi:CRISPR-associated endoribonuclease Cas6
MRILIKFRSNSNQVYQNNYFHKFQGFVYNLLKETHFEVLHDKKGYKLFCFSNLFPLKEKEGIIPPINENEIRNFIISSPSRIFIKTISEKLKELDEVHIGDYSFSVEDFSVIEPKIRNKVRIMNATTKIIKNDNFKCIN